MEYVMNTPILRGTLSGILPRILLVEDNPISREFLHEALKPLDISIDIAETLTAARLLARQYNHALFLSDVHLPDGGPDEIFSALRQLQENTLVVAITAEASPATCQTLSDMGYQEVWAKPISMATLQKNVTRLLGLNPAIADTISALELWDEAAALRAVGGSLTTLTALRVMFLSELPQHRKNITEAFHANDTSGLKSECHKLLAACGFVGAAGLAHAVKRLSEAASDSEKLNRFVREVEACLAIQNADTCGGF